MRSLNYTEGHFTGNNCGKCKHFQIVSWNNVHTYICRVLSFKNIEVSVCPSGLCDEFIEK